jgi:hypothetical protein
MGLRRRSGSKAAGRTAVKALKKAEKSADKANKTATKAATKQAKKSGAASVTVETTRAPFSSAEAKRLIGIGTTVVPLLAPYALAAVTQARGRWDAFRAARLGVSPDQLAAFTGPGGSLHARLSHLAEALAELEKGDAAAIAFAATTKPRLEDLSVAVRAAEQMPSGRRRTAFRAIGAELDGIELTLLNHLGVTA